ncbi:MAG: YkgJ family cysteine cluster protein [Nitrospiraceae bacterium]|nr:MAG: YkgJ family cysteine cluster protein [Nitrospiraceae bacterium]
MLLEGYYIVDKGIAAAIEKEQKNGRKPACGRGCSSCCKTHKDIPVYPLELTGISWYAAEKISGPQREVLRENLRQSGKDDPCPFLIEKACSIHPVRPMACRQFNVFGNPCEEGEDPYYTRRGDVLSPVKKHVDQAFFIMLPFYGVEKESERVRVIETGAFHRMVRELHSCNWKSLAEKMRDSD